ncbi:hypothetical protein A2334_05540 [Candidatus Roizmanbacteria bacterium RIFOXYB2_FULL_38_10]|uniref:DUF2723 domain-containing protein n=1 Tax=Candidatus Roizmanbacteria bacterium RIFOXYD1_FULL_38_12 TaxID=1802093 RepID=A0A1F7L0K4_9BACT|nr:MAG: hypothetical protein A3K47_02660 [Candidatus Roizmanbacteria bacterium RIFOXYA2_FULL_38_14]OGK63670.1 MAG: hypothetical protein A3K27_02660 [Candidatus Roizmanbacteria bacterium RIFOXYA1_FULL_37_12]OGK65516.1 MAG: hypothetical protein A3K38_02660 [Candidatus Roizmanbacteria bacterium RIFOXYB1_FULL_40_23]OGK68300.1 MAG: hypothetical protein A2334_05540 [Candidatus Roizmanbacteria bacterium RIFOXYB2_FULL_38_10]OGK69921.1 MAG: hypothetical protein A3K21_02665 [Candidatus Roizmanbacteria ba
MTFLYYLCLWILLLFNQSLYVFGGDSAEFSFVSQSLSVAHPPGYPFYSLLANIVGRSMPFFTPPWRVSLLSSIPTIITAYLIYQILLRMKLSKFVSILSSTLYIFLFPIWSYAVIPEVFALNNLFVCLITFLLYIFEKRKSVSILYLFSLLVGLSVSHHHIFVLFIPGWIYLMSGEKTILFLRKNISKRRALYIFIFFLLGCGFYLYPPLASRLSPPLDWENAQTLSGFIRLITRSTYGTFKAYSGSSGDILNQLYDVLSLIIFVVHDFRIIGIVLLVAGLAWLHKQQRRMFTFIGITILMHVFFLFYTNFFLHGSFTLAMYERFLIPIYLLFIIPVGYGLEQVISFIGKFITLYVRNRVLIKLCKIAVYLFALSYVFIVFWQNYRTVGKIKTLDVFATYAKNLLDTVPRGGIFFVGSDNSYFPSVYYFFSQNYRKDVKFVFLNILEREHYRKNLKKLYPELYVPTHYQKNNKDISDFLEKNARFGIYLENPLTSSHTWEPYGLLWKFYKTNKEAASDSAKLVKANKDLWNHVYTIPKLNKDLKSILHLNVVQDSYLNAYMNYSKLLFATNHMDESIQVIKKLIRDYRPQDQNSKMILMNLLVSQKKCTDATLLLNTLNLSNLKTDVLYIPSFITYYETCDSKSQEINRLKKMYLEKSKKSKPKLTEF